MLLPASASAATQALRPVRPSNKTRHALCVCSSVSCMCIVRSHASASTAAVIADHNLAQVHHLHHSRLGSPTRLPSAGMLACQLVTIALS